MKKTVTVNLNGRVFTMDEDAYQLLNNYLHNLRICFRKEEGSGEIIADFEARIEELFSEKIAAGAVVITLSDVEEVIARMGNPDEFATKDEFAEEEKKAGQEQSREQRQEFQSTTAGDKKFYRNGSDKMLGGVCSGIAAYFGWNTLVVRIITLILVFGTSLMIVPVYLLLWILFPEACTAEEKLRMRGAPVTVENIGKTVSAEVEAIKSNNSGCLAAFVGLIKVIAIGFGLLIGIPLLFAFIVVIFVLIAVLVGLSSGFGLAFDSIPFLTINNPNLAAISLIFVIGIPLAALIYAIISHFAKFNPVSAAIRWLLFAVWFLALMLFLGSDLHFEAKNVRTFIHNGGRVWNDKHYYSERIEGNGIFDEKGYTILAPVQKMSIDESLAADVHIVQKEGTGMIRIEGDQNLIDVFSYSISDGCLKLGIDAPYWIINDSNLKISLQLPDSLEEIENYSIGAIYIDGAYYSDAMEIDLNGVGKIRSDSLYVNQLKVTSEGVGSVTVAGKAQKAKLHLDGVGNIDAVNLVADTVYAEVNGAGKIRCDAVDYLHGRINGIGKIKYKSKPRTSNIGTLGIGAISQE
jgi:phage shock protein PspC (stress-responsive transcriptional regulator)